MAPPVAPPLQVAVAMADEASRWGAAPEAELFAPSDAARHPLGGYAPRARILVVDDNRDMRDYLVRLLAPHWELESAADGAQALTLARRRAPDLVLADIMMPGMNGFALLRELRVDPALSRVPVVLVTARAGEESAIEGLLAGADDYVVKPFSARELVARVAGQLEVARARRRTAELNAFRTSLSDTLRELDDPAEIESTASRMLVERLRADRARFVVLDEETSEFVTMTGHAAGDMPAGLGRYRMEDFAPLLEAIRAGRRLVIHDTQRDPCVASIRDALAGLQIGAQLVIPLVREDGSRITLAVHQRTPRAWTTEDVELAEELARRAWAEVERARAVASLRESEQQMRMAIGATGIVTWEWVPSQDRITTSDGFADLYGLPAPAHAADRLALVLPDDAQEHLHKVQDIASRGGSYTSQFRIRRPDDGQIVWLEERAEGTTGTDGTVERVIGVTLDITQRKAEDRIRADHV
jgi:PAS domain S-box-containing protein